jgi:hypothetical protein
LLRGLEEGNGAESTLHLLPFIAQRLAETPAVVFEGSMQHYEDTQRRIALVGRLFCQELQEVDLALAGALRFELQKLAQLVDLYEYTAAASGSPSPLGLADKIDDMVHARMGARCTLDALHECGGQAGTLYSAREGQHHLTHHRVRNATDLHS